MADSGTPGNTPNLDNEFQKEDDQANDQQSGNPRRENFKQLHGDDSRPSSEPTSGPPRDDTPPPPDTHEPYREPPMNPPDSNNS